MTVFDQATRQIGRARPRAEARRLLEGRGPYTADGSVPCQLHGCFLRSPHAHAIIRHVDRTGALAGRGASLSETPATPELVLRALGRLGLEELS